RSRTASRISCPRAVSARSTCATKLPRSGSSGPGYICETSRIRIRPAALGALRVVRAVQLAQHAADLADRAAGTEGLAHRDEQIRLVLGCRAHGRERGLGRPGVAFGPHPCRPLELAALDLRIDPLELDLGPF